MQITTIGLDIAKNVFQVHGIDAAEKVVVRKQLRRGQVLKSFAALPPCLIGMEACATAQWLTAALSLMVSSPRSFVDKQHLTWIESSKEKSHLICPFSSRLRSSL